MENNTTPVQKNTKESVIKRLQENVEELKQTKQRLEVKNADANKRDIILKKTKIDEREDATHVILKKEI